jgi:hypothetical protein
MAFCSILASLLLLASVFEVRPTSGQPVRGVLHKLDEKTLTLSTSDGERIFSVTEIERVTRIDPPPRANVASLPATLYLVDGTTWRLAKVGFAAGKFEATDAQGKVTTPRSRAVQAVRLQDAEAALEKPWDELVKANRDEDALIVRRVVNRLADDETTVISRDLTLDEIEGRLTAIESDSVRFEVAGDEIKLARERVEGIIFAMAKTADAPEATCLFVDSHGSRWRLQSAALENGSLKFTSVSGITSESPLSDVTVLDFSAANNRFLSDMEMASVDTRPFLDASFTGDKLAKLLAPKKDQAFFGGRLEGDDSPFGDAKGLSLVAFTRIQYRAPKGFSKFSTIATLDPRVKKVGGVMLRIVSDEKELFSGLIDSKNSAQTIELELPPQTRMLTIEADYGPRKELGASIQLRAARFSK